MILMICCNDSRNGNFTGIIGGLSIDDLLRLEPDDDRIAVKFIPAEAGKCGFVKIARRRFPIRSHTPWVGNWCWDAVDVSVETAAEILNYVQEWFHCEEGEETLWNLWMDGKEPITANDLRAVCQ